MFWQTNSKQTDTWKTLWWEKGRFHMYPDWKLQVVGIIVSVLLVCPSGDIGLVAAASSWGGMVPAHW